MRDSRQSEGEPTIREMLDEIERKRAAMPPEDRAKLEAEERMAQRESWIRAMAPCEHGVADFEDCEQCRAQTVSEGPLSNEENES